MASFCLCDTFDLLQAAIHTLSAAPTVYFDCEGYELGQQRGSLAIISLGALTTDQEKEELSVFLIDVLAFRNKGEVKHLDPIFKILQSDAIVKVVFDGRMDASELYHGYNVTLQRVVDLQIADIVSRSRRGESTVKQLERLRGSLPRREIEDNGSLLGKVQKLNGLVPALLEHGVNVGSKTRIDHSKWMERPLVEEYQNYAAEDVVLLLLLHEALMKKKLIDGLIEVQSGRYVTQHAKERPSPCDIYNRHGFLPLGILSSESNNELRTEVNALSLPPAMSAVLSLFVISGLNPGKGSELGDYISWVLSWLIAKYASCRLVLKCKPGFTVTNSSFFISSFESQYFVMSVSPSFHLCDSVEKLQYVIHALSTTPVIYIDCEGNHLGQSEGSLSIISIGVIEPRQGEWYLSIFLIDVLAFHDRGIEFLYPVFFILQSDAVVKVVFDGRMDASEFLHGYGIILRRVLDLQIADIVSRETKGETQTMQLNRLKSSLPRRELLKNECLFKSIHKLNGLVSALTEHGIMAGSKIKLDHSKWMQRPLDIEYQHYAALDIHMIVLLHTTLLEQGLINGAIEEQSARYIIQHAKARPASTDIYNSHGFLPLGILKQPNYCGKFLWCVGCRKFLAKDCFPMVQSSSTLCDTEERLDDAINSFNEAHTLFLDCEGKTLGTTDGRLSLVNLGKLEQTDDGTMKLNVYLIDILAFDGEKKNPLQKLFTILESMKIVKVVFDGRKDASELLHGHNVELKCVIDLQVADVVSRVKRGEGENRRIQRLSGMVSRRELSTNAIGYKTVHRLNGLDFTLREHGVAAQPGKQ
ncbi:5007_t:CDS:2, partial [Acaulospora colombiana]